MINKVYMFGNIGKLSQLPKSGGQTSCRRVKKGLEDMGIKVVPIRRHRAELQSRIGHVLEVGYFAFYDLFKMIFKMIFGQRKDSVFMQMTYAGALVPYELILTLTARLLGYRTIEYLQGGMVMDTYPKGGKLHKWMFKTNANKQELMLFEGKDALELVHKVTPKPRLVYYPSYIADDLIPTVHPQKPKDEINFLFFGRISKAKNTLIDVEIFNLFCKRNPNIKANLTLIGNADNKDYSDAVDNAIASSAYSKNIKRYGNSPYEFLVEKMKNSHFYLFPTQEKAEGHSNALNEAMSQGVIPIACDYHFNKSVIGDSRLVVKGYNPIDYVICIENIIKSAEIQQLSVQMWQRVKDNYTQSKVNKVLKQTLEQL